MSDHAEKFAAFVVWANADDDPEASWTMARWQAKALVAERDGLRARVEQLEAALRDLLDVAERARGGDPSLDSEEWYAARDFARAALSGLGDAG